MMKRILLLVVMIVALTTPVFATTYWTGKLCSGGVAAPNCSNSNDGLTEATAELTIAAGIAHLSAGDTLTIGDGTYDENINNTIPAGSLGSPTIIRAKNRNAAIIRSTSPALGNYIVYLNGASHSYVVFDGIFGDCSVGGTDCQVWLVDGSTGSITGIIIQNGTAANGHGHYGSCIELKAASGNQVLNNDVFDCGIDEVPISFAAHGVYVSGSHNIVDGNRIHGNAGYGVHINGEEAPSFNIVRNNVIHDQVNRTCVVVNTGTANDIYNNVCYGDPLGPSIRTDGNFFRNNTIYGEESYCIEVPSGDGNTIQNNLCYGNVIDAISNLGTATVIDHNLFTNPGFTNAAAANFTLASAASPANHAGRAIAGLFTDITGALRPNPPSIGAYEYAAAANPSPPTENFDTCTTSVNLDTCSDGTNFTSGWVAGPGGAMTIETAPAGGQGGKAIRSSSAAGDDTYYYRTFQPMSSANFRFELRSSISNPDTDFYGFQVHEEGSSEGMRVRMSSAGNIDIYDYDALAWVTVAAYSVDTNYRLNLRWDAVAHPNQYSAQVNEGTFTAWVGAHSLLNAVTTIALDDTVTIAHSLWFDAIGSTAVGHLPAISFDLRQRRN